jgi:thymidylate synthase (FAD)
VTFTFDVKAPIFVFRQWHRHRTWSYNEVSARYTELPEEFYTPSPEAIGVQDAKNHQSRNIGGQDIDKDAAASITDYMQRHNSDSFGTYKALLSWGVPRELARTVLPVAAYSHMFATVNLHNLFRFLDERLSPHAQYEIRVYAQALLELIEPIVPVAVAAWKVSKN